MKYRGGEEPKIGDTIVGRTGLELMVYEIASVNRNLLVERIGWPGTRIVKAGFYTLVQRRDGREQ